jgi:hypothetical protein
MKPTLTAIDWQMAILRAEEAGFRHFAAALTVLYLQEYPIGGRK